MGYKISWLAVQGVDKNAVYERLGLVPTGEVGPAFEHTVTGSQLSSGWTIVGFNELYHKLVHDDEMQRLSAGWTVMACNLCETTMCSTTSLWKDGEEVWGVWHFSNDSVDHLEMGGDLPPEFDVIEKHYRALQAEEKSGDAEVDYMIEIPVALATHITTFVHDQGSDDFDYLDFKSRKKKRAAKPR
jgi:hypothetical protein